MPNLAYWQSCWLLLAFLPGVRAAIQVAGTAHIGAISGEMAAKEYPCSWQKPKR